jgi:hypothetical protein
MARALLGKEERRATPVAAEADVLMNLRLLDGDCIISIVRFVVKQGCHNK